LSRFREIARSLLGELTEQRQKPEKQLLDRLNRIGILPETAVLDDVLDLTINDILERRLQTIVFNKGLTKSIHQARQLITHGHITIQGQRITSPSYLVLKNEEAKITYALTSSLANPDHPLRHSINAEETKPVTRSRARKEGIEETA
jgi:small subunit ribosomal protein S4